MFVKAVNTEKRTFVFNLICVLGGSIFLALLSQFSLPLWFTPVPVTLQTLGVMLLGALLGSKRGSLAVIAYLAEGAMGFPVFAEAKFGIAPFMGPTAGYLFGFIATAYVVGFLMEKGWHKNFSTTVASLTIGSVITLVCGALYLSVFVGLAHAFQLGVYPFLIGCGLKVLMAAAIIEADSRL